MKKIFLQLLLLVLLTLFIGVKPVRAIYSPASRVNNIFGIHILFTNELPKAAKLVDSSGGDWGYVTIPIQSGDRDIDKWQKFMDDAQMLHLIPIIRIATEPYWANTTVWRKPTEYDILDFANFLNSLSWPTKNHYILLFNEVNRYDEWGGDPPSPEEYADFVSYATDIFKSKSPDFFIIAGGLDNASPNDGTKYMDNFVFLRRMGQHNPDVFKKIDGFASHSYPNPNFAAAPSENKAEGTSTYKYEADLVEGFAGGQKSIFITETGWNAQALPAATISSYFTTAMKEWAQDPRIIAVTPFLLESNGGPFDKFTFYQGSNLTQYGQAYQSLTKLKGDPILSPITISYTPDVVNVEKKEDFDKQSLSQFGINLSSFLLKNYFKTVFAVGK